MPHPAPALLLAVASTEDGPDPEATREVVGLLLNLLGAAVAVVILLLVLGLPLRSWLRQRRDPHDPD